MAAATGTAAGTDQGRRREEAKHQSLVFDTPALIDLYRGKTGIRPFFEALLDGRLTAFISVVTEAELWRGLRADEVERHEALLSSFVPLALESATARQAGAWMQRHEAAGLGWMDALIVATATKSGLHILTRDLKLVRCLGQEAAFETYRRDATEVMSGVSAVLCYGTAVTVVPDSA